MPLTIEYQTLLKELCGIWHRLQRPLNTQNIFKDYMLIYSLHSVGFPYGLPLCCDKSGRNLQPGCDSAMDSVWQARAKELQAELRPKLWKVIRYHLKLLRVETFFSSLRAAGRWLCSMCAERELFQNTFKFVIISKYKYFYRCSQPERNKNSYGKILLTVEEGSVWFDLLFDIFHPLCHLWCWNDCLIINTKVEIIKPKCYFLLEIFFTSAAFLILYV